LLDRTLLRSVALIARSKLTTISGLDHIQPSRDPFIIALNHSSRHEALLLPALLIMCRSGQRIISSQTGTST
jgi:1-acyl-sn-glycerol-3-phosphate acyltransferase